MCLDGLFLIFFSEIRKSAPSMASETMVCHFSLSHLCYDGLAWRPKVGSKGQCRALSYDAHKHCSSERCVGGMNTWRWKKKRSGGWDGMRILATIYSEIYIVAGDGGRIGWKYAILSDVV